MGFKGISLRYKFLAALTLIPVVGLSLFLALAVRIFEKDKIAYVFDSSLSVAKTRAARVNSEVSSILSLSQAVVLSYRADTKNLAESGQYYFDREAKLQGFELHAFNSETSTYERTVDISKIRDASIAKAEDPAGDARSRKLVDEARTKGVVILRDGDSSRVWLAARFGPVSDPKHIVALTLFDASELQQVFSSQGPWLSYLLHKDGSQTVFASQNDEPGWGAKEIWGKAKAMKIPEGIAELKSPAQLTYLVSFVDAGVSDLVIVSAIDRASALEAVNTLLRKSLLFFLALISATAIIAVYAARGLTGALTRLNTAARQVAGGDFAVRVDVKTGGEIGGLADSFNAMAVEVQRLMLETAEKARMEGELKTAQTVQETLFPEANARLGTVDITGHYLPASECGGDWWYYFETDDKVYIWIGDVTGHGAPAALLTSAARAVASVLQNSAARPVGESLGILNRAICETSKGKMMMTFFLACIDTHTGEMTYSNASHEAPLIIPAFGHGEEPPSSKDFVPLIDCNNPRLGENINVVFKESRVQLKPGEQVVFYTDGVTDVKSPEDKAWGERRFLKALSSSLKEDQTARVTLNGLVESMEYYRASTPLDDDVTLVMCSYKGAA